MSRLKIFLTLVIVGGAIFSQSATAQNPYAPQSPVISPWMGLWNRNTGPLDNYHNFVVPQMELNQTLQMQNAALNRQALGLQMLNGQLGQPFGSQYGMVPTGQSATFMNYSHFYGGKGQMGGLGGDRNPPIRRH